MSVRIAGAIVGLIAGVLALSPGMAMAANFISGQGVDRGPMIPGGVEVSRAPYQESVQNLGCNNGADFCGVEFTVVPVKARLEITNVTCFALSDHELDGIQLAVRKPNVGSAAPFTMLLEPGYHTSAAPYETSANNQVSVFANAGQHIEILTSTQPGSHLATMFCSISGSIVKLKK